MPPPSPGSTAAQAPPPASASSGLLPGVALSLAVAALALLVGLVAPVVSPLLVAILLGAAAANLGILPSQARPGLTWSGKRLLRIGIVLLGLQLSLTDVLGLGAGVVVLVMVIVAGGITATMLIGAALGVSWTQRLLIACGFSICGAAAVAAADGTVEADERETATAIALVVAFGTAMIAVVPVLAEVLGLAERTAGIWAGSSIHEVAQVVAAGGIIGSGALSVAVLVKLARVLLLAPVLTWAGWRYRQRLRALPPGEGATGDRPMPPLVPLFVVGFCLMVVVHTWAPVPDLVLSGASRVQTLLLAAAMFALGCGVRWRELREVGPRPVLLAVLTTAVVAAIGLVGALLVG